ncbi:MAG: TOBE domain-containing protein [Rhodospirillales bacterium]|nr:TOBE domain-containing protein [Rhodospirillales bacterium]
MNFIPAEIEATEGQESQVRFGSASLPAGRARDVAPGPITLGVRPEHLYIAPAAEADFRGRVEIVEKLGGESLAYLQTEFTAEPVTIKLSEQPAVRPGDEVPVRVGRERFHLFGEAGTVI